MGFQLPFPQLVSLPDFWTPSTVWKGIFFYLPNFGGFFQRRKHHFGGHRFPWHAYCIYIYIYQEPQTTIYKWLFQLDDFKPLHRKWSFHQTSNLNLVVWGSRYVKMYRYTYNRKTQSSLLFRDFPKSPYAKSTAVKAFWNHTNCCQSSHNLPGRFLPVNTGCEPNRAPGAFKGIFATRWWPFQKRQSNSLGRMQRRVDHEHKRLKR